MALYRLESASLAATGLVFLSATWLVGIFRPAASRVAAASQQHVWFIRAAFGWLVVTGGLAVYYGVRSAISGDPAGYVAIDALRHTIGVGVASQMIVGMGLLVLPEFAVRRMQHPSERALPLLLLALLNSAAALRVGAALAAPPWTGEGRLWLVAVSGGLAEIALVVFAALFVWGMLHKERIVAAAAPVRSLG